MPWVLKKEKSVKANFLASNNDAVIEKTVLTKTRASSRGKTRRASGYDPCWA